uniref:Uncharacterized protein n=1 Tax=Caenorhabditis japonica TaxID=281687 RepID=A0A8R1I5Z5_CAEJA
MPALIVDSIKIEVSPIPSTSYESSRSSQSVEIFLEKYESNPDVGFAFVLQHIHNRAKSLRFCEEQQRKEMIKQRYPAVSEVTTVDAEADK